MVAGAHTSQALAPPWQPGMHTDMSHATTAAMGVAAGILLARPMPDEFGMLRKLDSAQLDRLPTDFALMLTDNRTGQLKNNRMTSSSTAGLLATWSIHQDTSRYIEIHQDTFVSDYL